MSTDQQPLDRSGGGAQAAAAITAWAPGRLSASAASFAREVVRAAGPGTPARAKALLFAAGRLAAFAEGVGIELSPRVLLCEAVIERFVLCGCGGLAPASVRTLRTNLRTLARSLARALPAASPGAAGARAREGAL